MHLHDLLENSGPLRKKYQAAQIGPYGSHFLPCRVSMRIDAADFKMVHHAALVHATGFGKGAVPIIAPFC